MAGAPFGLGRRRQTTTGGHGHEGFELFELAHADQKNKGRTG
jgi:hypothetical protein